MNLGADETRETAPFDCFFYFYPGLGRIYPDKFFGENGDN
jgi:hypothetical protein